MNLTPKGLSFTDVFRVGGGGFWASLRVQKGPHTRRVFARADYIRLKED